MGIIALVIMIGEISVAGGKSVSPITKKKIKLLISVVNNLCKEIVGNSLCRNLTVLEIQSDTKP